MEEKKPIRPVIKLMQIGQQESFPIERMNSVRKTATEISIINGWKFSVNQQNEAKTITVTRIQ